MHDAAQRAAHRQRRRPHAQRAPQVVRLHVRHVGADPVLPSVWVQIQVACSIMGRLKKFRHDLGIEHLRRAECCLP